MKKKLLVLPMLFSSIVNAGLYIGGNVGTIDFGDVEFTTTQFVIGSQFNEYVGVELRHGRGIDEESIDGVKVELDSVYGGYLTLSAPLSDSLSAYVIVGKTWAEATASYGGYSESAKDDTGSVGLGARYSIREALTIRAEYMKYDDDVDGLSIGVQVNF